MTDKTKSPAPAHRNCTLTECLGKPRCRQCLAMDAREDAAARPHRDQMQPFEWLHWAFVDAGMLVEAAAMSQCLASRRSFLDDAKWQAARRLEAEAKLSAALAQAVPQPESHVAGVDHFPDAGNMVAQPASQGLHAAASAVLARWDSPLWEFAEEVRRTGDTRLASMAIAVIAKATQTGGGQ